MLFRVIMASVLAGALVVLGPVVLPRGAGGSTQSLTVMLGEPVLAWRMGYYIDPYRSLFSRGARYWREDGGVTVKVARAVDGSLAASNLPDAAGEAVTLDDGNADLIAPTRGQGLAAMVMCWLLLGGVLYALLPARWFTKVRSPLPARQSAGVLVPYDVLSRQQRPMKDITPAEDVDPKNEREADRLLRHASSTSAVPPTDPSH